MTTDEVVEVAFLARLIRNNQCKESIRFLPLIHRYEIAEWIMPSSRKNEWVVRHESMAFLYKRLGNLLPSWEQDFSLLDKHGLDPMKPQDIESLPALKGALSATGLVNRRTWNAIAGLGPKRRSMMNTEATLTIDWILRFRPNKGLIGRWNDERIDLWEFANNWNECPISQRKWMTFQGFEGVYPKAIITCENLGSYIDLKLDQEILVVFSPGNHIAPAVYLLGQFPCEVAWLHFGDLDPEGIEIGSKIAKASGRPEKMYIPSFAMDYIDRAQKKDVSWASSFENPVLAELARHRLGIFQEVFMLDSRLKEDISKHFSTKKENPPALLGRTPTV